MNFELNKAGMKKLEKQASGAMQSAFDRTFKATSGKPETLVRTRLRAEIKKAGFEMSDKEIREFAKLISDGVQPKMTK